MTDDPSSAVATMRQRLEDGVYDISEADLVVINEESHGKFLAIGRAQTDGDDMVGDSGKVVKSLHHVGDDLFEFSV